MPVMFALWPQNVEFWGGWGGKSS